MSKMNDYREMIEKCVRCGFCQAHCPTFKAKGAEPFVARGRLDIINATLDGRIEGYNEKFFQRMNQCLLCGNCTQNCPPGIETEQIIMAARAAYIEQKGVPEVLGGVKENIMSNGNITGDDPENRMLWMGEEPKDFSGRENAEYLYFTGCVPSLYPSAYSIAKTFTNILDAADVSYTMFGKDEVCCGFPLLSGGLPDEAKDVAEKNVAAVMELGVEAIIVTCPTCYHMWAKIYPELLGRGLGFGILHSTEFLHKIISKGKLEFNESNQVVTYHDSCDLGRKSGIFEQPREILEQIPGITLKEMRHNKLDSMCCGGGGNLEMNDAALSNLVAQRRVGEALDTGAKTVVTACQQCKRTIQGGARSMKARIKVKDICEIVYDSMKK